MTKYKPTEKELKMMDFYEMDNIEDAKLLLRSHIKGINGVPNSKG